MVGASSVFLIVLYSITLGLVDTFKILQDNVANIKAVFGVQMIWNRP